eukprot:14557267-Alexandrium_andersonii.AAC.1
MSVQSIPPATARPSLGNYSLNPSGDGYTTTAADDEAMGAAEASQVVPPAPTPTLGNVLGAAPKA